MDKPRRLAIAPAWHTVVVLIALLALSLHGARSHSLSLIASRGRAVGYATVMVVEWAIAAFIWYGVSRRGVRIGDLVAGRWTRAKDFFRDIGIALVFLLISGAILTGVSHVLKAAPNQALRSIFPRGAVEVILFVMLAATAGFCEELIFRGYLQRQFAALTQASVGGIVLQAIAFGAGHGYQGWKFMVVIAVFGTLFGLLAYWRRSLRPGMLAHFFQDAASGLLGPHMMR